MDNIYNLISDGELLDELADCIRNRNLEQKFLYLNNGSDLYYEKIDRKTFVDKLLSGKDLFNFGIKNCFSKGEKIAFVSLGCGNSMIEEQIFNNIEDGYNISYFGVDSAKRMLVFSQEAFKNIKHNNIFVHADISTKNFRSELNQITAGFDKRIFTFFSGTFSNIEQTNIIDILYNLLNKGEKIWLDIRLREGLKAKDDMNAFKHYRSWLSNEVKKNFYFNILNGFGIPYENGKLIISTKKEKSLNALQFQINFQFTKKTEINIRGEKIFILPDEVISLQQIRNYDPVGLVSFFEEHGMKFKDSFFVSNRGMFLFEKI